MLVGACPPQGFAALVLAMLAYGCAWLRAALDPAMPLEAPKWAAERSRAGWDS